MLLNPWLTLQSAPKRRVNEGGGAPNVLGSFSLSLGVQCLNVSKGSLHTIGFAASIVEVARQVGP